MKTTKYILYARKSSEAEERQVMSIEAQLTELEQFAQREGIKIVDRFIESKSAKSPGRSQFNKMLERIYSTKEPIGLIAWHPDRLARNSVDGGQIVYLIDMKKICSLKFPTFWFEPTPQGLFMLQVAFGQSKYYSDNLSENVKRGIRQKLRRGEWLTRAPFGYVNNAKTRNIEPDAVKAKIIQTLFKEFSEGKHSLETAAQRLSFLGIVNRFGKQLGKSVVHGILTNPLYTGRIVHKGESYEGNFTPLIDNEIFEAVQRKLKQSSRPHKCKHKHDFPFTGLFKCSECGGAITAQFAKGRKYRYYRCSKKFGKCGQSYLNETELINQLQQQLQKISLPNAWSPSVFAQLDVWEAEERGKLQSFAQNLAKSLLETQSRLDRLVTGFLDGVIDKESYLQKKDQLIKQKIDLESKESDFGQKAKLWVEPMREWLETAHNADKLAFSNDLLSIKSFLENAGTNRLVENKKVVMEWSRPFDILLKYKCFAEAEGGKDVDKKEGQPASLVDCPLVSR